MKNSLFSSRRFRRGSVATAITVLVLIIIVLINMVVSKLSQRYSLSLDLTSGGIFTISDQTTEYLTGLGKEVQVYVLNNEQNFSTNDDPSLQYALQQAAEVIGRYDRLSDNIHVTFVDIVRDPGFVSLYSTIQPQLNNIIVESGGNVRLLLAEDLFNWQVDEYGYYITSSKAEQAMTGAIVAVTSDEVISAAVLGGHAESQASGLTGLLLLNNYEVSTLNTMAQDIPPELSLLIVSAPQYDYTSAEIEALDAFLYNGGNYGKTVFYLAAIDQDQASLPNLTAFLARWGVRAGDGSIFETNYNMLSANSVFFTNALYAENEYSRVVARSGLPVAMPNASPLEAVEAQGVTTAELLQFSGGAGVRPADAVSGQWSPSPQDASGPYPALLLSQRSEGGNTSNVLVSSTSLAVEETIMATPTLANSRYFLSLLGSLTSRADNVVIENKTLGAALLNISYGQALVWGLVFFILLPLVVLAIGVVVFFKRRHL